MAEEQTFEVGSKIAPLGKGSYNYVAYGDRFFKNTER
jgi:hypothetical protein